MEMIARTRRRSKAATGLILVFCCLLPTVTGGLIWREARHQRLNAALLAAVDRQDVAAVSALLRQDADPNTTQGSAPPSFWELVRTILTQKRLPASKTPPPLLRVLDLRTNTYGEQSAPPQNIELVRVLVDYGARLEAKNPNGKTPLALAAWTGDLNSVRLLLSRGARSDNRDFLGDTPLMLATLQDHADIVRLLIDAHVNVNARDNMGNTALDLAERGTSSEIISALKAAGAQKGS